jgi:hypothetical protein
VAAVFTVTNRSSTETLPFVGLYNAHLIGVGGSYNVEPGDSTVAGCPTYFFNSMVNLGPGRSTTGCLVWNMPGGNPYEIRWGLGTIGYWSISASEARVPPPTPTTTGPATAALKNELLTHPVIPVGWTVTPVSSAQKTVFPGPFASINWDGGGGDDPEMGTVTWFLETLIQPTPSAKTAYEKLLTVIPNPANGHKANEDFGPSTPSLRELHVVTWHNDHYRV